MRGKLSVLVVAAALLGGASVSLACPGHAEKTTMAQATLKYVELADLATWVEKKDATIVDANKAETFAEGHIPGAVHATADMLTAEALPADKAAKVVFYCYNEQCGASHKVAKKALELGYTNVYVFKAGIEGWKKAGKQVEVATVKGGETGTKRADG